MVSRVGEVEIATARRGREAADKNAALARADGRACVRDRAHEKQRSAGGRDELHGGRRPEQDPVHP